MKHIKEILLSLIIALPGLCFSQQQWGIEKLSFNKNNFDDFSPAFFQDGLLFCSNRKSDIIISYTDTSGLMNRLIDIYYVALKKNNRWADPARFSSQLNTLFNDGPLCFYNHGRMLVFTRNLVTKKSFGNYTKDGNTCGLFFAEFNKNKLSRISKFPYNSEQYNVLHPAITEDGQTLFFSSNMPGGQGGYDIWVSYYKQGNWTQPVNLGSTVNTDKNEAFPFIHTNGKLFFSSKGWDSRGGYDIFFTQQVDGKWLDAQNMKDPFNTKFDDFGFIADSSMASGYLTSNRFKSDDIFKFASFAGGFNDCKPQRDNNFCYTFFEEGTSGSDMQAGMKYEWDLGDGTKIRDIEAKHCFAKPGEYLVKLNVIDSLTGEVYFSQADFKQTVALIEQPVITAPDKVKPGEEIQFNSDNSNLPYKINNFYWDFGDGFRSVGAETVHTFYDEGTYEIKLSVEGNLKKEGNRKACVTKNIVVVKQRK